MTFLTISNSEKINLQNFRRNRSVFNKIMGLLQLIAVIILPLVIFGQNGDRNGQPNNNLTMTIEEYEPKSTLKVPVNLVTRAKYPIIDIHNHQSLSLNRKSWRKSSKIWKRLICMRW